MEQWISCRSTATLLSRQALGAEHKLHSGEGGSKGKEEVDVAKYGDFTDAHAQIGCFIYDVYRMKRMRSALGYLALAEFEAA